MEQEIDLQDGGALGVKIFQRLMSEGPQYVEVGGGRRRVRTKSGGHTSGGKASNVLPFPDSQKMYQPIKDSNCENRRLIRNRSAGQVSKQQMISDCGLKSANRETGRAHSGVSQGEIYLNPPDHTATVRRGMSGSKVRPGSVASIARGQASTPQVSVTSDWFDQDSYRDSSPYRLTSCHVTQYSNDGDGSPENPLVMNYKWNNSEQGQRLQRQLTRLSSCRSMRRSSEMMKHRLDPMYLMSGSKVGLGRRYDIGDSDVRKLKEMTQMREDLLDDLSKMKYPYTTKASAKIPTNLKPKRSKSNEAGEVSVLPTPATDLPISDEPERPLSQHSGSQISNEASNEPLNEQLDEPLNEQLDEPLNEPIPEPLNEPSNKSLNEPSMESVHNPSNESLNESSNDPE